MADPPCPTSQELAAAAVLAERGFLAAGQSLEAAIGILDRLTQHFAGYVAELTGDGLAGVYRELAAAGGHVAALAEARRADAASLLALGGVAAEAQARVAALGPVTQEIEILSLSARVVAGGMGNEAADFAAFARHIRDAAQHARSCLAEASGALTQVHQELAAAGEEAAAFEGANGAAMQTIPERLAANLRTLAARQQLAADAAVVAHQRSEDVRQQVAQQIVALQLGDITRQRLEHVLAAEQLLSGPYRRVGELLAAQLDDAADELSREGDRIEAGLGHLARAAHAVGQLGIDVHGDTDGGGFVAALEADIQQSAAMFGELSAGDAGTSRRMAAVLAATELLASRLASVQSVQEDIRIMGLNATLKCGRLGEVGRPLAAVAAELRLCSGRFGAHAATVLQDVDHLRAFAVALRDPARHGKHAQIAQSAEALVTPLLRLRQLEQELVTMLSHLHRDADEVGKLVEAAVEQFSVRHALAQTLRAAADGFAAWDADGTADCLDRIAGVYTMAREREVHARFAPLPRQDATAELTDILF